MTVIRHRLFVSGSEYELYSVCETMLFELYVLFKKRHVAPCVQCSVSLLCVFRRCVYLGSAPDFLFRHMRSTSAAWPLPPHFGFHFIDWSGIFRGKTQSLSWLAGYADLSPDCKSLLHAMGRSSESLLFFPRDDLCVSGIRKWVMNTLRHIYLFYRETHTHTHTHTHTMTRHVMQQEKTKLYWHTVAQTQG